MEVATRLAYHLCSLQQFLFASLAVSIFFFFFFFFFFLAGLCFLFHQILIIILVV